MQKSISFIKSLKLNNNREWFRANKGNYEEAREEFHSFVENITNEIQYFLKNINKKKISQLLEQHFSVFDFKIFSNYCTKLLDNSSEILFLILGNCQINNIPLTINNGR